MAASSEPLELAVTEVDVLRLAQSLAGRLEHLGRAVDRDDPRYEGGERARDGAGPAAEVGDGPAVVQQAEQGQGVDPAAELLVPQPIPLAGGRREELAGAAAPLGEHALQPAGIFAGGRGGGDLLAREPPEVAGRFGQVGGDQPVEPLRPLGAALRPAPVGQDLQVAADGRLGELQHPAELRDRQFCPLQ